MKNKYYPYKVKTSELPLTSDERDVVIKWIYDTHLVEWYTTYLMKKSMEEDGVEVVVQIVPSDKAMSISKVAK